MSPTLQDRLRHHYEAVADQLELPERTIDDVLSRSDQPTVDTVSRRSRGLMVAAGFVLVASAVGLIAVRQADESAPATQPTTSQAAPARTLVDATDLADSDWVTATVLAEDSEWLWAHRRWFGEEPANNRVIAYGQRVDDGTGERLWIEIGPAESAPPVPTIDAAVSFIDIDGTEWGIDTPSPDWWSATRRVGRSYVNVRGQGEIDRTILAGLVVMDETELPFVPFGGPSDAFEVARTTLGENVYSYSAQESNDYYCNWVRDGTSGLTGGCAQLIEPNAVITIGGGSTEQQADADDVTAVRAGSVSADVELVEVDFANGTTLTVEPTDLSGQFDRRFWIVAATIGTESQLGIPITDETVGEARAYDTNGNLVGTIRPPWVPDDTAGSIDNE